MSREYLVCLEFKKAHTKKKIKDFMVNHWYLDPEYLYVLNKEWIRFEQTASGREPIEQYMLDLCELAKKHGLDIELSSVHAHSLHPDKQINLLNVGDNYKRIRGELR